MHVGQRNALTIDLEDWYQGVRIHVSRWPFFEDRIEPATDRLLELLAAAGVRATFFVLGYVAQKYPRLIRAISADGHEIATHGYQHKVFGECSVTEVRADLRRSIDLLEDVTQRAIRGHRAPFFSITRKTWWAMEVLAELGLQYDSSVFPIHHWRCGIPDAPRWIHTVKTERGHVLELPPSTARVARCNVPVAGGAYLRLWPYRITAAAIKQINAKGHPAVVYLHPWELDPGRPKVKTDRSISIAQGWNRDAMLSRICRLLGDFSFAPVEELLRETAPDALPSLPPTDASLVDAAIARRTCDRELATAAP